MLYAFGRCKVIESLFTKLYFLSSHSFPVRLRRRGNYAIRSTNHHRFVDYSSEPNSLLRCRKTIRRREFHFCNNTTDTYFLSIKLSRLIMQIIPPNRLVSFRLGGSEDYSEKGVCGEGNLYLRSCICIFLTRSSNFSVDKLFRLSPSAIMGKESGVNFTGQQIFTGFTCIRLRASRNLTSSICSVITS